jgi:hypothetical protein
MTTPIDIRASYWEGSGRVAGSFLGKPIAGLSYTELTGYVALRGTSRHLITGP